MIPLPGVRLEGVVAEFDDHAGFGEVEWGGEPACSGGRAQRYWFHCTQLVDGSRHAEPGQPVTFRIVPGHNGRWEAAELS